MLEQLRKLIELQEVDCKLIEIVKVRDSCPKKLDVYKSRITLLNDDIENLKEELVKIENEHKLRDDYLKMDEETVKKWETRLKDIKTNREFQALQREIEIRKKANGDVENEILGFMEKSEEIKKDMTSLQDELGKNNEQLAGEEKEISVQVGNLDKDIKSLDEIRNERLTDIDKNLLRRYDYISKRRLGLAIVCADEGSCTGCNVMVPPQLYNILMRANSIEACPNCQRILYYAPAVLKNDEDEKK